MLRQCYLNTLLDMLILGLLYFKDIPGASEQTFLIVRYCYRSFKQL